MEKFFDLPFGTRFAFDEERNLLTLVSLCGMTCGHNQKEDDYSNSGMFVICADSRRLEGKKLQYSIAGYSSDRFEFTAVDEQKSIEARAVWTFDFNLMFLFCVFFANPFE